MAKLLGPRTNDAVVNLWLFIFRVAAGGFMLTHGIPKFLKLIEGNTQFADPFGIGPTLSLILTVFAEFLCSVLIMLGIGTRLASIPLIATMGVAAFIIHASDSFQRKEMALLYLIVFITILVFGGGKFALGRVFRGR
ncbi:DoxX family protein [Sunxiuqinia sp. sy24]|uniref:DoxX family protein n=1 Tax=Sunxiuqinia sp. sy24 TaxID=3461495 RepID=UPI004045A86B